MKKLRIALIGAGYMGRLHSEKFARLEGVELAAVADADGAAAAALGAKLGCPAHADWRRALARMDAAVVAVPTELHREIAGACLEAGLHVLVEKPIARTRAEADELVALAARAGRTLQVGHVERYNDAFRALAARMDRPLFIDAERLSGFRERGTDVDVVLDLMIHDLDLALALARSEVAAVSACGFRVLTRDIDIANARIEFASGCVANLSASRVSQSPLRKLRVFQPDLYVSADLQAAKLRYVRRAGGAIEQTDEAHGKGDALAAQARAFVATAHGRAPVEVSGADGARSLALALEVSRRVDERLARFAGAA
jgi:predicted dehydrogenase